MVGAKPRGTTLPPCLCALVVRLAQAAATRLSRGDCRVLQRGNGAHTLAAWCLGRGCNHFRVLDVSAYPDDVTVPSFGRRLWCGRWGHRGAEARPKWSEMHKHADERLSAMHPIATEYIAAQRMTRSAISVIRCDAEKQLPYRRLRRANRWHSMQGRAPPTITIATFHVRFQEEEAAIRACGNEYSVIPAATSGLRGENARTTPSGATRSDFFRPWAGSLRNRLRSQKPRKTLRDC